MSMSLLKYLKVIPKLSRDQEHPDLPDPTGPLSIKIPSSTIATVNAKVVTAIERPTANGKRGPYTHLTPEEKYRIGKRAAEFGVTSTLHHYSKTFPDLSLKVTSVRHFKNQYQCTIKEQVKSGESGNIKALPTKTMGRPLLIGEEADGQVREYVQFLRQRGSAVDTSVVITTGEGVLESIDANLLKTLTLTKGWSKSLLTRMDMVKRKVSSKAKVDVKRFDIVKQAFLLDIKNVVCLDEIPPELIINRDQTAIQYVPVGSWTMESEGAKSI